MRKQNSNIIFRIDKKTQTEFKKKLSEIDMNQARFLRYCIKSLIKDPNIGNEFIDARKSYMLNKKPKQELRNEISRIGNNLNQYIHNMNILMNEGSIQKADFITIVKGVDQVLDELYSLADQYNFVKKENCNV